MRPDSPTWRYLYESESREREALARWLPNFGGELLAQLGLRGPAWCGLGLPRRVVLGQADVDGDVDIVAGPLGLALSPTEFEARVKLKSTELAGWHPSHWSAYAAMEAAGEGLIRWPPDTSALVACEAKASWFDRKALPDRAWRASQRRAGKRVVGQLRVLEGRGFARVCFLHLAVTRSLTGVGGGNPWLSGGAEAFAARDSFPMVYEPRVLPWCGYFRVLLQPVAGDSEEMRGVGGWPDCVQAAPDLSQRGESKPPTFSTLVEALGRCARPLFPSTFVLSCAACESWWTTPELSGAACPVCGASWPMKPAG